MRLMLARMNASQTGGQQQAAQRFMSEFESVRKEAVGRMMEDAVKQAATKDDVVKLVHTLDDYAMACQGDLTKLSSRSDALEGSFSELQAKTDSDIQRIKSDVSVLQSSLQSLGSSFQSGLGKLNGSLRTSSRVMKIWLVMISAFLLIEGIALVYLLSRRT